MVLHQRYGISLLLCIVLLMTACNGMVPASDSDISSTVQNPDNTQTSLVEAATSTKQEKDQEGDSTYPPEEQEDQTEHNLSRTESATSSPTSRESSQLSDTAAMQVKYVQPAGIVAQFEYVGPQAGGGEMTPECLALGPLRDESLETSSTEEPDFEPFIELFGQPLAIGQKMTICYIGFTAQTIKETIIGPDGDTIRSISFTAEPQYPPVGWGQYYDVDATDYMVLPDDPAGIYTVISETPWGTITKEFEVTDQMAVFGDGAPFVTVLSRGTSQIAPAALKDGLVVLSGFASNELLTLTFWQVCKPQSWQMSSSAAEFVVGAEVQVGMEGSAFVRVPEEISTVMQNAGRYELLVIGTQTPNIDDTTGKFAAPDSAVPKVKYSARHGNAIGRPQPENTPPCSQPAQPNPAAQQSQDTQQTGYPIARATASNTAQSSLDSQGNPVTYGADNAVDGILDTTWRVPGTGIGESLRLEFAAPIVIEEVQIIPGYAKIDPYDGTNRFLQNRRIRRVRLEFSDGTSTEAQLIEQMTLQPIQVASVTTDFVRIVVLETTDPGATDGRDFTAISEVVVLRSGTEE